MDEDYSTFEDEEGDHTVTTADDKKLNPFAAPPIPTSETIDDSSIPTDMVIIPKIVTRRIGTIDDIEKGDTRGSLGIEETVDDKHQHYFIDQIHFDRPQWPGKSYWWFSCAALVAFMVDFSNLSSMPTAVANNGGTVFIFAYIIVLALFVYPALYLELLIGQYFETGYVGLWGITPLGRGVGAGLFYINFLLLAVLPPNIYWASVMMVDALTAIKSGHLVWIHCNNDWNTCRCERTRAPSCLNLRDKVNGTDSQTPAFEYFVGRILQMWKTKYTDSIHFEEISQNGNWNEAYGFNNNIDGLGPLQLVPSLSMLVIFIVIMTMGSLPLRIQGYFFTFTTSFTVFVLALLTIRGLSLDGAFSGLSKYLVTDLGKLFKFSTWYNALERAVFSIGPGLGGHIFLASFNQLGHDCHREAIAAIFMDTLTSILGCFMAFMYVGHSYKSKRVELPDKFPGENFVFIALADSFGELSGAGFFATIFYFMLVLMSADTHVVTLQSLAFSLYEEFKRKYPNMEVSSSLFFFSVWGFAFCMTLAITTRGGYWLYKFMTEYAFGLSAFVFVLMETIIFSWLWGLQEVCIAFETIRGYRPPLYLRAVWKFVLPIVFTAFLIIANFVYASGQSTFTVFGQETLEGTENLGFLFHYISLCLVVFYPFYVFIKIKKKGQSCKLVLTLLLSPEYEHDEIVADIRTAQRLYCHHYTFFRYEDEQREMSLKDQFLSGYTKLKAVIGKVKSLRKKKKKKQGIDDEVSKTAEADTSAVAPKKKEKKKKKKKLDPQEQTEQEDSAWELWDKAKQEKEELEEKEKALSKGRRKSLYKGVKSRRPPNTGNKRPSILISQNRKTGMASKGSSNKISQSFKPSNPSKTVNNVKPVKSVNNKVAPAK